MNALAGLLSMNTNIGLRHFLPLGVDPDPIRRTIFCRVISHVMDQGGRLEVPVDPMVASRRTRIGEVCMQTLRLHDGRLNLPFFCDYLARSRM